MIITPLPLPASGPVPRRNMLPQSVKLYVLYLPLSNANSDGHVLQSFWDLLHQEHQKSLRRLSCRHPHSPESSPSGGVRIHCRRDRLSRHNRHHCHQPRRTNGRSLTSSCLWTRRRVRHQLTVSRLASLPHSLEHLQKWELRPGVLRQRTSQNRVTVTNSSTRKPPTSQFCLQCPRSRWQLPHPQGMLLQRLQPLGKWVSITIKSIPG